MTDTVVFGGREEPDLTPMFRSNKTIRLRPADANDTPFLWALFATDEISYRWVFRGRVPTLETISANLQRPDILPNIIETVQDQRRLGYVAAFDISDRNGHAQLGVVVVPEHLQTGLGISAAMLFVDYLFTVLPLRKVYLQSIEYCFTQYRSLIDRGYATQEGVLRDHEYFAGRYWDVHILGLTREKFLILKDKTKLRER